MPLNWLFTVGAKDCGSLVSRGPITQLKAETGNPLAQQRIEQDIVHREAAKRAAEQQDYQSPLPTDSKAALNAQLQRIENQRHALEDELARVHDAQKDAGPENKVRYTKKHTAWGHI